MSGCLQLPKIWPWESSPLQSGQRGYWLPGHEWHTPLEGYVLIPDLTCPVFEDISLV